MLSYTEFKSMYSKDSLYELFNKNTYCAAYKKYAKQEQEEKKLKGYEVIDCFVDTNYSTNTTSVECIKDTYISIPSVNATGEASYWSLAPLPTKTTLSSWGAKPVETNKNKGNDMCYNTPTTKTEEQTKRDYLTRRLDNVFYTKSDSLHTKFNLHVNNNPKSYKDLIEKITKGQFKLDEKRTKKLDALLEAGAYYTYSAMDGIIWEGEKMPDQDGYNKAQTELYNLRTATQDIIALGTADAALKAITDLAAWEPTGAAN